jgi:hypothetical protein
MRFSIAVMVVLVGMCGIGVAQKSSEIKSSDRKSSVTKPPKSTAAPSGKVGGGATSSSKELQNVERQSAKTGARSHAQKAPKPVAIKTDKSESNPPMKFGGKGSSIGTTKQASNPYKGRLKQKGGGRH